SVPRARLSGGRAARRARARARPAVPDARAVLRRGLRLARSARVRGAGPPARARPGLRAGEIMQRRVSRSRPWSRGALTRGRAGARHPGLRVIADLVMNHTSDAHPWFQAARSDPASPYHEYYVWSDSDRTYREARIIFTDTEKSNWTFDPVAKRYYWHRFFSHQPDLNYDNPAVKAAMLDVMRCWLDRGLDGFRCDAVPYLIEREGTSCENLPETHAILKEFRRVIDAAYSGRVLLAEANQWPEDVRP